MFVSKSKLLCSTGTKQESINIVKRKQVLSEITVSSRKKQGSMEIIFVAHINSCEFFCKTRISIQLHRRRIGNYAKITVM